MLEITHPLEASMPTNITRRTPTYSPFGSLAREVEEFRNRAQKMFDEPFPRWMREGMAPGVAQVVDWYPVAEVAETDKEFAVTMELPGMKAKDVNIEFNDNMLTIRGEKSAEREEKERKFHLWERSYGSFQRSFEFPTSVNPDAINAEFRDGVLHVHVAKRTEAAPSAKKIAINEG